MNKLGGKVAIVTGSGQGIGSAIALALAREGAKVVTNNRQPGTPGGDAETTATEIIKRGGQAIAFWGDVSEFEVAGKLVQYTLDKYGRVDILVNNVGVHPRKDIWEMEEEDWDNTMKSHLKSAFNCVRHTCGLMKEKGWGRIMNCTSGSWLGNPGMSNYGTAKAGIVGFTRCVARDMARYGVTCNAYHPMASTRRTVTANAKATLTKRYELHLISKKDLDFLLNMPEPSGVGTLVAYLATEEAGNINGQVFYVAGGDVAIYTEPVKKNLMHKEQGIWTVKELINFAPDKLLAGYKNPVPK